MTKRCLVGRRLWGFVLVLVPVFFACAGGSSGEDREASGTQLTAKDQLLLASAKVALPPEGVTPADLPDPESLGAQYLAQYCVTCHALPSPAMHSATDWPSVTRRMWLRMELLGDQFPVPVPGVGERIAMLTYLDDHALLVSRANLPDMPGRDLFISTCSRCHQLPDPGQHSEADWVGVVRRMMGHMEDILGQSLSGEDMTTISRYVGEASQARSSER